MNRYQVPYLGGATPFVISLDTRRHNTQLVVEGFQFGGEGVTAEVQVNGANTYSPVTLATPGNLVRFTDTVLKSFRVSGLDAVAPESAYLITVTQF